jgi:hypothetical protein
MHVIAAKAVCFKEAYVSLHSSDVSEADRDVTRQRLAEGLKLTTASGWSLAAPTTT